MYSHVVALGRCVQDPMCHILLTQTQAFIQAGMVSQVSPQAAYAVVVKSFEHLEVYIRRTAHQYSSVRLDPATPPTVASCMHTLNALPAPPPACVQTDAPCECSGSGPRGTVPVGQRKVTNSGTSSELRHSAATASCSKFWVLWIVTGPTGGRVHAPRWRDWRRRLTTSSARCEARNTATPGKRRR